MSFRLDPRLPLTSEARRIAGEETQKIIAHLESARQDPETGLHDARKRIKALRALLRLVRPGDEALCRAENARFRDISMSIAGPRQATALIETVDRLIAEFPDEADAAGLAGIRAMLVDHRARGAHAPAALGAILDSAVAACRAGAAQLGTLSLPDLPEDAADVLAEGAKATLRQARKALKRARKRGLAEDFHELRKATKTHLEHLALLRKVWPGPVKARRERVDALGESLGNLHDVFVMQALIAARKPPFDGAEPKQMGRLLKRSEKALRKLCIAQAEELFEEKPGRAARKLAGQCRAKLSAGVATPEPACSGGK